MDDENQKSGQKSAAERSRKARPSSFHFYTMDTSLRTFFRLIIVLARVHTSTGTRALFPLQVIRCRQAVHICWHSSSSPPPGGLSHHSRIIYGAPLSSSRRALRDSTNKKRTKKARNTKGTSPPLDTHIHTHPSLRFTVDGIV